MSVHGSVARTDAEHPVLAVTDLNYRIGGRHLLKDVELQIRAGESVAVVGPSGSGKSSLLSCILGLIRPQTGRILVDGDDVVRMRSHRLAKCRHDRIGMVFQFGELIAELTPLENVALPALLSRTNRRSAYARAGSLLDELHVPKEGRSDRLSGGERQRAAVARALINGPDLIIADEPTGALDDVARRQVAELLFDLPRTRRCAMLIVTHDASIAAMADRVVILREGVLSPAGPAKATVA